jgi:tetratricopeptide (TPR) repeat protein
MKRLASTVLLAALQLPLAHVHAASLDEGVVALQADWAVAKYRTAPDQQDKAFTVLTARAEALVAENPGRAEPLVWEAIIVSSHAGATGGLGALGKVKKARELLEKAEKIDPNTLHGSIYTSLGSLYYQVPGWPLGFGDHKKAEEYLKKAVAMNQDGIDPNYFYGDFLRDEGRYQEAAQYLKKALAAPDRPGRTVADTGRREEARQALAKVEAELKG